MRDKEAPPVRDAFIELDDDENDVLMAKKNRGRPDRNKKEKDKLKKQAEASIIRYKMDGMKKSRDLLVNKTLGKDNNFGEEEPREPSLVGTTPRR
jgi:hypothetical protein